MIDDTQGLLESQRRSDGPRQGAPTTINTAVQAPTDKAWAVAFKINVVITFLSAIYGSSSASPALGEMQTIERGRLILGLKYALVGIMLVVPSVHIFSWVLLRTMIGCSRLMVQIAAVVSVLMCAGAVKSLLYAGNLVGALELAIVCALITVAVIRRRNTIQFAASNVKAAALTINSTPKMMSWVLFMMAFRAVWLVVAIFAILGPVANAFAYRNDVVAAIASFFGCFLVWGLSVMWQFAVIGNVVAATVAISVASWCSSPDNVEPVWDSFRGVLHSSLGSLCKVAVIDGFIGSILGIATAMYTPGEIFTSFLRLALSFVSQYTVFFVGMYRLGFTEGRESAFAILRTHGLTIFLNSSLMLVVAGVPVLLAVVVLIVLLDAGQLVSPTSTESLYTAAMVYACAVLPALLVTFEIVVHAFTAVFVSFIQDPEAFAEVHGDRDPDGVYRAWRQMRMVHPGADEDEGGVQV